MRSKYYFLLLAVFGLSFLLFFLIPGDKILKNIAATPALCALLATIYQVLRDHSAHIKKRELLQKQQNFSLGVSSYMAQKTFDKHIEFCEKYIAEVHKTSVTLWKYDQTSQSINHGRTLCNLRIEYSTWVTDEISNKLIGFEEALYLHGAKSRLSKKTKNFKLANKLAEEAEKLWEEIIGKSFDKEIKENEAIAIGSIINYVRNILGIDELIKLRTSSMKKSLNSIKFT